MQSKNFGFPESSGSPGLGKKYKLVTLGCQMNEHDSEVAAGIMESLGYTAVRNMEEADAIIINTCAVRKKPEEKVAALLGKLQSLKEEKKDLFIAVGGCMTQQEEVASYIKKRFCHVNLVFGTHSLPRLPELLIQALESRKPLVDIEESYADREGLPVRRANCFKAWLPVIYGCNNYCSYCIVPYVRGRERSRPLPDIVKEAEKLAGKGYLEITLLGQNVNSYGIDLPGKEDFADLLENLERVSGIRRLRFMTSHPKDLSRRLIDAVAGCSKVCEHFHLPVQSGSDRILKQMNRRYDRRRYLDILGDLRRAVPGIAVTTDLIVGYPGETEEDFAETISLVEEARFDNAFIFLYSLRKGTRAAKMPDDLPRYVKERRLQELAGLQKKISFEINRHIVGENLELLVEGASKSDSGMQTGRSRTGKLVHFPSRDDLTGKIIQVKVTEARTWNLIGEITGDESGN